MKYPVMLETSQTFTCEDVESVQACMSCTVCYHNGEDWRYLNRELSSIGTAYPISYDKTGLYEAGANGVRRLIIDETGSYPRIQTAEEAYVSYDENGKAVYTTERDGETVEISEAEYNRLYERYLSATPVRFEHATAVNIIPDMVLDALKQLEAASGQRMETYICADLNRDGYEECIGAFAEGYTWQFWYRDPVSGRCAQLLKMSQGFDECSLCLIRHENETHVVANAYNLMGNNKRFSIFAMQGSNMHVLAPDLYGYVYQNERGEIILDVESYDGYYDADVGVYMTHTWKDTYLYYENGIYKEYGALKLSEAQFLRFDNAADILSDIRAKYPDREIVFSYFLRENGIAHIQCCLKEEYGSLMFFYYTLYVEGTHLTGGLENYYDGQMASRFSAFEATYPTVP